MGANPNGGAGLRPSLLYDLTRCGGVSLKIEYGEEALLEGAHTGEARGGRVLSLTLTAGIDQKRLANAPELFEDAVDAEVLVVAGEFALQQGSKLWHPAPAAFRVRV